MNQARAPKSLVWRKKNEGLIKGCTSKGNKAGHGGKVASFFVGISLGKGICYGKYYEKLSGKIFAEFIENNFIEIFKSNCDPTGNIFVQDGDPSQNSKAAKTALDKGLYNLVYLLEVRILLLSKMLSIKSRKN